MFDLKRRSNRRNQNILLSSSDFNWCSCEGLQLVRSQTCAVVRAGVAVRAVRGGTGAWSGRGGSSVEGPRICRSVERAAMGQGRKRERGRECERTCSRSARSASYLSTKFFSAAISLLRFI
jgi:hypothetical protein